jgi:glyoxylase-like metal-dependent hydrolase (beta-lactamase superfamily II)
MLARYVLAASLAALLSLAAQADAPPKPQRIAAGVWLIPGGIPADREPDGNTVVFDAPQGLIVMDTGRHAWHRAAILDFAKTRGRPIVAIINSHWHLDHVSGNPDLRAAYPGLKVYASNAIDAALTGFLAKSAAEAKAYLDSGKLPPQTAEDIRGDLATFANGQALRPDIVIDGSTTRTIAGRPLQVNLAPDAATAGDVWVYDAASHVAAAGDLVTLPVPFLDTACPVGWSAALARIAKTPFRILVPGHGLPMTRIQFGVYRTAFDALIACSASPRDAGACAADWSSAVQVLPGAGPPQQAVSMTTYYVKDVLRAHGGKSAECRL